MSKRVLYLTCLFCVFLNSCGKEEVSVNCDAYKRPVDRYVYPLYPGGPGWSQLTTFIKQTEALQIPQDTVNKMSTDALIQSILDYPFAKNVFIYDPQNGFLRTYDAFSGYLEIKKRSDIGSKLNYRYSLMEPSCVTNLRTDSSRQTFALDFAYIELLLSQDFVLNSLDPNVKKAIVWQALRIYEGKKKNDYYFGQFLYSISLSLCSRIMQSAGVKAINDLLTSSIKIRYLNDYGSFMPGVSDTDSDVQSVIKIAREYSN